MGDDRVGVGGAVVANGYGETSAGAGKAWLAAIPAAMSAAGCAAGSQIISQRSDRRQPFLAREEGRDPAAPRPQFPCRRPRAAFSRPMGARARPDGGG
ncbi:hypothetical protein OG943_10745 [Amycolatopsis sp. NBC_00345]|uniref:hypothetical protein n=1 Tax=Amycolatopsis sp. NBC_00345 TaxID=2975955 RepID=UPI002E26052E